MNAIVTSEILTRIQEKVAKDKESVKNTIQFFQTYTEIIQECSQALSKAR